MLSLSDVARDSLEKALGRFGRDAKYVIFPFGEGGKILKGILNYEYNISETAILDNGLAIANNKIKDISYLHKNKDAIVLFSAYRTSQYHQMINNLYKDIPQERCVEIYKKINALDENIYSEIMRLSKIHSIKNDFVRVGNLHDGGYVMVDDMPGGIAYSFGISNDPSWDFDMCRRGYEVYMYDHTVECPSNMCDKMHFFKLGISSGVKNNNLKTLEDIIKFNKHEEENDMILKMDVEGAEWGFLQMTSSKTLSRFRQIVLELHDMDNSPERIILGLSKLYETHRVVHVHGNNYGGFISTPSHNIPYLWEVTYLRKDYVGEIKNSVSLPIKYDSPCNEDFDEIILGDWNRPFVIDKV